LSVLVAGLTVVVAIAGVQLSGIPMISMMGWGAAIMVAVTMLAAITLLPALLGIVGRRVNSLRVPFIRRAASSSRRSASARWSARVVRRPVPYAVGAALVLVLLALPALSMRLGFADAGNDAPTSTTRKAYDLVADAYGPGVSGPLQIVIEPAAPSDLRTTLPRLAAALGRTAGIASVSPPVVNKQADLAVVTVVPETSPQDQRTSDLVTNLREDVIPAAVDDSRSRASVTGLVAVQDDVAQRLADRMPMFLAAVIALSFLVLALLLRSLFVPLKAAVLNVLSVGASYGVVVAVFQWGWAAELIGVHDEVPIMALAPMLMFAILFGLSMDYEVFLVGRIREAYLDHGDARRAIVDGVGSTARVVTSAALIMVSVFGAFVLADDVTTKLFGVGLAVAVLLDVTLVRMVLLPAVMSLLGDRAWALPRLRRRTTFSAMPEAVSEPADQTREPAPAA
jgi:RND superfamily putative drug exporter